MATPTIPNGEEHFFPIIYEGNGAGQRVGSFVPFTDNGTIANSCIFNRPDDPMLSRTPSGTGTNRRIYTMSVWFKTANADTSDSNGRAIFFAGPYGNDDGIQLSTHTDPTLRFWLNGASSAYLITNRTFEDTSKFYHLLVAVDTTQGTAANRVKIYIDGDQITSFSTETYPSQDYDGNWSTAVQHNVGAQTGNNRQFDGYLAEFNYVDGTALTPSTFGLTDTSTGNWIPKTLTGITYGTNGFRLKFQDSSALGDDTGGGGNDFTATNLASTDQTTSTPTSNYNTFASFDSGTSATEGNLTVSTGTTNGDTQCVAQAGFGVATGKWYWEVKITTVGAGMYGWKDDANAGGSRAVNNSSNEVHSTNNFAGALSTGASGSYSAGSWFIDGGYTTEVNYTTVSTNDVLMFAIDLDNGKGYCGKNGTWFNSANPANGTGQIGGCHYANGINKFYPMARRADPNSVGEFNFGQKSFAHTPPTGFSTLQQDNLPETAKGVSGLTWIKDRDNGSYYHTLVDSSRGANKEIYTNSTAVEASTNDSVTKFLKGGVAVEDAVNVNKDDDSFVSYNWVGNSGTTSSNGTGSITSTVQVNSTSKFSIVEWTGTGANGTVGHGLSETPDLIIFRSLTNTSGTGWWVVWTKDLGGANKFLYLNAVNAIDTSTTFMNNTLPTSSVFSVGANYNTNDGGAMVAYCWADVPGFSKTGTYKGNGSASNGSFVWTGFKPAWLMIKRTDSSTGGNWSVIDNARYPSNPIGVPLLAETTTAESGLSAITMDLVSNGFKLRNALNSNNASGASYMFIAFAEHPFVGDGTNPVTAR